MSVTHDDGPLNIDDAAALLATQSAEVEEADEPAAVEEEGEAEPAVEEEEEEEEEGEVESEGDETGEEEEEEAAADEGPPAPASWAKEDHAVWAKLAPEARAVIAKREADRDKATRDAAQRAGQAAAELKRINESYEQYAPVFKDGFQSRWGQVDWVKLAGELTPQQYNAYRAEMEEERTALAEFEAKSREAAQAARQAFLQEEAPKLAELAPEIATPGEQRVKLASFLREQGFEPEQLAQASAAELSIAYDAMRYREARANAKAKATDAKKQPAKPAPKVVKAQPAASVAKVQQTEVRALERRVAQTRSLDDAASLLLAREKKASARKR